MGLANLPTLRMINFSAAGTAATGSASFDLLDPDWQLNEATDYDSLCKQSSCSR